MIRVCRNRKYVIRCWGTGGMCVGTGGMWLGCVGTGGM